MHKNTALLIIILVPFLGGIALLTPLFCRQEKAQAVDTVGTKPVAQKKIAPTTPSATESIEIKYQRLSEKLRTMSLPIWQKLVYKEQTTPVISALVWIGIFGFTLCIRDRALVARTIIRDEIRKKICEIIALATTVIGIILAISCIFLVGSALKSLINPDYYVIEDLMKKLK